MRPSKCSVCGQDWEYILSTGRCARCEAAFKEPDTVIDKISWELDGSLKDECDEEVKEEKED